MRFFEQYSKNLKLEKEVKNMRKTIYKYVTAAFIIFIAGLVCYFYAKDNFGFIQHDMNQNESYAYMDENDLVFDPEKTSIDISTDELVLDQNEAYIAISKNDMDGYNRWLPFYFAFSMAEDLNAESVEKLLDSKIDQAVLYTQGGELYHTEQLIWSASKQDKGKYNLTLVLIPELDSLMLDGVTNVTNITLVSGIKKNSYDLPAYLVEEKPTIAQNDLYVSLSSTESDISEDLTAYSNYGIMKNGNDIQDFSLDFSQKYMSVIDCSIVNAVQTENDTAEYSVIVRLAENSEKTVFRPFIKVDYGNHESGFLVPSVPVYFRETQVA